MEKKWQTSTNSTQIHIGSVTKPYLGNMHSIPILYSTGSEHNNMILNGSHRVFCATHICGAIVIDYLVLHMATVICVWCFVICSPENGVPGFLLLLLPRVVCTNRINFQLRLYIVRAERMGRKTLFAIILKKWINTPYSIWGGNVRSICNVCSRALGFTIPHFTYMLMNYF